MVVQRMMPEFRGSRFDGLEWFCFWQDLQHGSLDSVQFMFDVLMEFKRVLKSGGKAVLVIGDVRKERSGETINLAENVWKECAEPLGFKKIGKIQKDYIGNPNNRNPKVSRIWGEKKGKATNVERFIVIEN